jgi:hypothetical protein
MLCKVKTLVGYTLDSLDGAIGKVKEFYFDDRHWTIRYLVAETGTWLMDRKVLIAPYALVAVNKERQTIAIDLTRRQIEGSPSLDSDKPVSHQFEQAYYAYYGLPTYWDGPYSWGGTPNFLRDYEERASEERAREHRKDSTQHPKGWDPNLRSTYSVSGHYIQALEGKLGHVEDFIIDDETWVIRYLIVDTHNWWPGKKVLISPQWIERVSWGERKVFVKLDREAIKQSPEYTDESLPGRDYEIGLHEHYKVKGYWMG